MSRHHCTLRHAASYYPRHARWRESCDVVEDRVAELDLQRARALAGLGRIQEAHALVAAARDVLARFPGDLRARALANTLRGSAERSS